MRKEQSLVVSFKGWINSLEPIHRLSEQLNKLLDESSLGVFDGHEIALDGSHGQLFFYGTDVKGLLDFVKPTLQSADLLKCTQARLRSKSKENEIQEIIIDL